MYEEMGATILCRDTRHSCREKNKTVGSKLCRDIIKVCHDRIQEKSKRIGHDRKLQASTKAATKTKDSVVKELSMSRQSDQFGLEN